jgi:hypothetical protein
MYGIFGAKRRTQSARDPVSYHMILLSCVQYAICFSLCAVFQNRYPRGQPQGADFGQHKHWHNIQYVQRFTLLL